MTVSLAGLIKDAIKQRDLTVKTVAPAVHMKPRTLYMRLHNPETFQVQELRRISKVLKIPPEDILTALEVTS